MRILLTRPRAQSEAFAVQIEALGATPLIWPLLEIRDLGTGGAVPRNCDGVVFTSLNGVRAVPDDDAMGRLTAWCVGARTAESARAAGYGTVRSAEGSVSDLADLIRHDGARHLLYMRGRDVSADLSAMLGSEFVLDERIVYEARPVDLVPPEVEKALASGDVDAISVWSARTGAILMQRIAESDGWHLADMDLHAISQTAAAPLASAGFRRILVASRPDAFGMVEMISAALRQK